MRKLLRSAPASARRPVSPTQVFYGELPPDGERGHFAQTPPEAAANVARYIAQLTREMSALAGSARLDMLAYLLEMANAEADAQARAETPPQS